MADAYEDSVGKSLAYLNGMAGTKPGDPARAAAALLAIVDDPAPPLHLLLGSDPLRRGREKLDAVIEEMDRWEELTRSTDFAEDDEHWIVGKTGK